MLGSVGRAEWRVGDGPVEEKEKEGVVLLG